MRENVRISCPRDLELTTRAVVLFDPLRDHCGNCIRNFRQAAGRTVALRSNASGPSMVTFTPKVFGGSNTITIQPSFLPASASLTADSVLDLRSSLRICTARNG